MTYIISPSPILRLHADPGDGYDVTERNRAEAGLQQTLADLTRSNADLQQFAYVASHDLQEPLRNVASCLQLLEKSIRTISMPRPTNISITQLNSTDETLILDLLRIPRIGREEKPYNR
jgi:light-regulated signal transduction histidine kinase (bacteriophytochrome)